MRLLFRPLGEWPREKTKAPEMSPFRASWTDTLQFLEREIEFVIARRQPEVLIQVDAPEGAMRIDGGLRADARVNFHGVMVSFESKFGPQTYMCDKYSESSWARRSDPKWQPNVRAIAYGLEALRKIERYGIANNGQQYTGWKALGSGIPMPGPKMTMEQAARILHVAAAPESYEIPVETLLHDPEAVRLAYRTASKKLHPDKGGDHAQFARITEARDLLLSAALV